MPGSFSSGFNSGFGPLAVSGIYAALIYFTKFLTKETGYMQTEILTGSGSTTTLVPGPYQCLQVNTISIDVPLDEVGSSDPYVTISGATTGAYSFHGNVSPNIRFKKDEFITVTTTNFTDEYSAVVGYVNFGNSSQYYADLNRSQLPLPSRLTRNPRNGS